MAKSMGEALSKGIPVVFTRESTHQVPEVICEPGKEREALELLQNMGLIEIVRPQDGRKPAGSIQVFSEKPEMTDEELLKENGWTVECESPFEIRHEDGSFGCGRGAMDLLRYLRDHEND